MIEKEYCEKQKKAYDTYKDECRRAHDFYCEVLKSYIDELNKKYADKIGKYCQLRNWGFDKKGIFLGFYALDGEIAIKLAKPKKDGSPSAVLYRGSEIEDCKEIKFEID